MQINAYVTDNASTGSGVFRYGYFFNASAFSEKKTFLEIKISTAVFINVTATYTYYKAINFPF